MVCYTFAFIVYGIKACHIMTLKGWNYSNIILKDPCSECDYIDTLGKSFSFITISQFEVLTNPTLSHTHLYKT